MIRFADTNLLTQLRDSVLCLGATHGQMCCHPDSPALLSVHVSTCLGCTSLLAVSSNVAKMRLIQLFRATEAYSAALFHMRKPEACICQSGRYYVFGHFCSNPTFDPPFHTMFFPTKYMCGSSDSPRFDIHYLQDTNNVSRTSKRRRIAAPNQTMRLIHHDFCRWLRKLKTPMPNATGCQKGDSPLQNILRHRNPDKTAHRFFVLLDIKDAYPSAGLSKLAAAFEAMRHRIDSSISQEEILGFLTEFCIDPETQGLYMGSPSSPDLFNLCCEVAIDRQLRVICDKWNITYTRYLDDLTFSANAPIGHRKRTCLCKAIVESGFAISHKKARVLDIQKNPIVINGVGLRANGQTFLPRHMLDMMRGKIWTILNAPTGSHDVGHDVIAGLSGLFYSVLDRFQRLNAAERKIVIMLRRWKKMQKRELREKRRARLAK